MGKANIINEGILMSAPLEFLLKVIHLVYNKTRRQYSYRLSYLMILC